VEKWVYWFVIKEKEIFFSFVTGLVWVLPFKEKRLFGLCRAEPPGISWVHAARLGSSQALRRLRQSIKKAQRRCIRGELS
jgi:hypothetical protein